MFTGVLRNKQLDFAGSERDLAAFLERGHTTVRDRALVAGVRGDNAAKTFRYADAAKSYEIAAALSDSVVPTQVGTRGDSAKTSSEDDLKSDARLWGSLAGWRPPQLNVTTMVQLAGQRDKAGLLRVPVKAGSAAHSVDAVFDTGADVTTMTRSLRDSALAFPAAHYAIEVILGLPVIRAFGRVVVSADGTLSLGPPSARGQACGSSHGNLMLGGLKLLVTATASDV